MKKIMIYINSLLQHSFGSIQKRLKGIAGVSLMTLLVFNACNPDDIGDNYYTFTGETIGYYITNNPDRFSEFSHLLDTTGVKGLLNAYGEYTCFAPDNDAMFAFYQFV